MGVRPLGLPLGLPWASPWASPRLRAPPGPAAVTPPPSLSLLALMLLIFPASVYLPTRESPRCYSHTEPLRAVTPRKVWGTPAFPEGWSGVLGARGQRQEPLAGPGGPGTQPLLGSQTHSGSIVSPSGVQPPVHPTTGCTSPASEAPGKLWRRSARFSHGDSVHPQAWAGGPPAPASPWLVACPPASPWLVATPPASPRWWLLHQHRAVLRPLWKEAQPLFLCFPFSCGR